METLTLKKQTFPVTGMTCAGCASNVQNHLSKQAGIASANVNLAANQATIESETDVDLQALRQSIQAIGYDLIVSEDLETAEKEAETSRETYLQKLKTRLLWSGVLTIPVVVLSMVFPSWAYSDIISAILSFPVVFFLGSSFFSGALKQLKNKTANMDTLVALSTSIAFVFSLFNLLLPSYFESRGLEAHVYFEAAAVIITFILLGKLLEERAKSQTSDSIKKLMSLQPKTVTVIDSSGKELEKSVKDIAIGDHIVIRPGQKIPVDGKVIDGHSFLDESTLTGEPLAVEKSAGDAITSGTTNQQGSLTMVAEKVGEKTFLNQLIKMVQEAQGSKASIQKLVDKVAAVFVPVVIGLAILTMVVWILSGAENAFTHGLLSMITVLVIACPCALGLATPTAIMVGIGKGSDRGILIKDAQSLEIAHQIDTVVLDKTGTITEGKPEVKASWWRSASADLKSILNAIESKSEHPLASAICDHLIDETSGHSIHIQSFMALPGKGVLSTIEGKNYLVGNLQMAKELKLEFDSELMQNIESWQEEAMTIVLFFTRKEILAAFGISDAIKKSSIEAIRQLLSANLEVVMLTGDNDKTAKAVAEKVGISRYQSGLSPQDKADAITQMQKDGKKVAMVGDGVNDTQALALADISIAMGQGSDIAIDVANITIVSSELTKVSESLKLSRDTVKTIRQNLFWAFVYNVIGIPVAAGLLYPINGFLLNPMIAGAAMALSSVSVVTNSLRLKFKN